MAAGPCLILVASGCEWSRHQFKHFPYGGMKREHTRHGPARYLAGHTDASIRELERATVCAADKWLAGGPSKNEYVRETGQIIGWDRGLDSTISYVECSGGNAARSFHGRPMHETNPKLRDGGT